MDNVIRRREFLRGLAAAAGLSCCPVPRFAPAALPGHVRVIPSSGRALPAIGLGSWLTFDVSPGGGQQANVTRIVRAFLELGGGMIDSSPMYGRSEARIGDALAAIEDHAGLFSATKVWIPSAALGRRQLAHSLDLWGLESFDLVQVHNLVDWQAHLPWLREWRAQGRIRHVGVTTSHGRRHGELEEVLRSEVLDFVQLTYNVQERAAEQRLLPLARDRGVAVIVNRPFERGGLFRRVRGRALPDWAGEIDCANWAQFFLKFIISHPDITCAIPATTNIDHLRENMGALHGALPDTDMRQRMIAHFGAL